MQRGTFTLDKTVTPVGVGHKIKRAIVLYQFINQALAALIVHVVIARAVNQQKFTSQVRSVSDG